MQHGRIGWIARPGIEPEILGRCASGAVGWSSDDQVLIGRVFADLANTTPAEVQLDRRAEGSRAGGRIGADQGIDVLDRDDKRLGAIVRGDEWRAEGDISGSGNAGSKLQ